MSGTMAWFMLAMVLYPDAQKKAQEEIDAVVGRGRLPSFDDLDKLVYIRAMVKETLRWHPVGPLGEPCDEKGPGGQCSCITYPLFRHAAPLRRGTDRARFSISLLRADCIFDRTTSTKDTSSLKGRSALPTFGACLAQISASYVDIVMCRAQGNQPRP